MWGKRWSKNRQCGVPRKKALGIQGRRRCLRLVLAALLAGCGLAPARCPGSSLIYFETDGGAGNPRGLYNFDTSTGTSTLRAAVAGTDSLFSMAVRPSDGTVLAVGGNGNNGLYTIDVNTGIYSLVASLGLSDIANIAFDPVTSVLYGLGRNTQKLYTINQTSGALTTIGTTGSTRSGLAFSPADALFGTTVNGLLYAVNPSTAADTLIGGTASGGNLLEDAAFTATGEMFVTDFHGSLYQVNTLTGARTLVGSTGMGDGLLGLIATPTPEPETALLLGFGALTLGISSRRLRRRQDATGGCELHSGCAAASD